MRVRTALFLLLSPAPLCAQGVVNESLLRASGTAAKSTWSSRTFEQVQASVVHVVVEVDGPRGKFEIERASSGVIVDASGLVLTFQHLVREVEGADDKQLLVQLNDASNTRLAAQLEAVDETRDLALLRVRPPEGGLRAAALGVGPQFGEPVLVVSRPEGEDMLAFAGVASPALGEVQLQGHTIGAGGVFLTDSRNDERCDGAPVFGSDGVVLGLYATEHVRRDVREPKLEDLKQPSFGVVLSAFELRAAFPTKLEKARPQREAHAFGLAVARVAPSVLGVYTGGGEWPAAGPRDPGCVQRRRGLGSGVALTAGGLVVTNAHVVGDGVRVRDGKDVFDAEVVARDRSTNLALLQVELPDGRQLVPAAVAADDDALLAEAMLAVGRPTGEGVVVSGGVVSAMRAREGGRIQADANLGNQNGGGAIVDAEGRLIGIGDAGAIDPIDMAFAMRGDGAQQETNLSTFVSVAKLRRLFAEHVGDLPPVAGAVAARRTALVEMVEKASGAMLNIYVARNIAVADPDDPFPPEPRWMPMSLGSGVVIDRSGLAVSNWHVVDAGTHPDGSSNDDFRITARVFGGREYEVEVLSISREDDLSLLRLVLEPGEEVQAVELGSSDRLAIGEAVAAIGNPHGRANTITYGVVSAKGQGIRVKGRWAKLKGLIETDAAINGGNSGGALLDMDGRLVGINSAGGGTFNNVGYAIAVDHVRRQLTGLLMQPYKLRSPDLGMRVLDDEGRVVVMDVDARGPAARAGVRSGDRILALAGTEITWSPGFAMTLRQQPADVELVLSVERQGKVQELAVTPVRAEVWSVVRQANLEVRDFAYVDDPERVRLASVALHRAFTGDATAEPRQIPAQVVAVERAFEVGGEPSPLRPGDLILAVELRAADGRPLLEPIGGVAELRDWFNNRELGSYDGQVWPVWIARDGDVEKVDVVASRLLW